MALVRFVSPFTKITNTKEVHVNANNIRELCKKLINIYGLDMKILLDEKDELSQKIIVLVNRRNAHTLQGADTTIENESEILIMPFLCGG